MEWEQEIKNQRKCKDKYTGKYTDKDNVKKL